MFKKKKKKIPDAFYNVVLGLFEVHFQQCV